MSKLSKIFFLLIILAVPLITQGADIDELRQDLENQIRQKQEEINQYQQKIGENQQKARTLNNEIQILEDQISQIRLEINQIDLTIQKSTLNIQGIDGQINILKENISQKKDLLAEYIRTVALYDQETLLEVILKNEKFSDFFDEIKALESAQEEIQSVLGAVQGLKNELEGQKGELEDEREEQYRLKSLQLIQRRTVENRQGQKEDLLNKTRGEEWRYQQMIQGTEKEITFIKEQLSLLERYHITLEEAIQDAIFAGSQTGVRPAFLLGVLEAESRLGLNVGTGTWQKDMYQCYRSLGYLTRAEKEKNAFLQICQELGLNPDTQPVSAEPWYGCGGAMGVAQFMPTTWLAYKERTAGLTGHRPPNPWNHQDAFTAAAIKLGDGGANQRTEIGERHAYAKYLGGSRWKRWVYSKVTDYVIKLTANFQQQYFE
ncbi:MAG: lytic murein transglycosylase [Candidatus Portnoybacteria bacterium]|nr:lytic murein transglycosylase [Candidatus Portnoybacteria bacterium]